MSDAVVLVREDQDIDARIRRNVKVLMAGKGVRATVIYRALGLSRQAFSARLNGTKPTKFSVVEVLHLASLLGVTVEELAMPTEELVARQNWKNMTAPDLQLLNGAGKTNGKRALWPVGV